MKIIEQRAKIAAQNECRRDQKGYTKYYIQSATEQRKIDIEKLKEAMNRLMLDTHDKAEIMKAMDGRLDKLEE